MAPRAPLLLLALACGVSADAPEPRFEAVREGLLSAGRGTRDSAERLARELARTDPMGLMALWDGLDLRGQCLLLRALGAAGTRHAAEVALARAGAPEGELFRALVDGLVAGGEASLFAPVPEDLSPARREAIEEIRLRYRLEAEFVRLKSPTGPTGHYAGQFARTKKLGPAIVPILLDIVQDRARPLPGESAAGPYAAIHADMVRFDSQELRGMAAYALSEVVEPVDDATIDEMLRLHRRYAASEESRFEEEDLAPSLAFSLFDLGVEDPARKYIATLLDRWDRTEDERLLWDLGYAYIRVKQYAEGERWYGLVLREDTPSKAIAAYNLACNFSMRARDAEDEVWRKRFKKEAVQYLSKAIEEHNYGDWKWMEEDGDLDFIRGEPEYRRLLAHLQRRYPERGKGNVAKARSGPR